MKTEERKVIAFRMSAEERKAFDILCTQNDTTMQDVLSNFVKSVLKNKAVPGKEKK
jgi:hypothetical protein